MTASNGPKPFDPLSVPLDLAAIVEASAGTGKTYSITFLYLRAILERGLSPSSILVVTFSRAATAELRKRIRERLASVHDHLREGTSSDDPIVEALLSRHRGPGKERAVESLESALDGLDRANIETIDGYFGRILKRRAFESGLPLEMEVEADETGLIRRIAEDRFLTDYTTLDLEALSRRRLNKPKVLEEVFKKALGNPEAEILPESVDDADGANDELKNAVSRYVRARGEFDVEAVRRLIKQYDKKLSAVDKAFEALEAFAENPFGRPTSFLGVDMGYLSASYWRGKDIVPKEDFFEAVDNLVACATRVLKHEVASELHPLVERARENLDAATRGKGIRTFNLTKTLVHELVVRNEDSARFADLLAEEHSLALVDESQDTDTQQFEVFLRIFGRPKSGLVFIGDPKQAIYGFRGADVSAYLEARANIALRYTMTRNFRSTPKVIEALDVLYKSSPSAFSTEGIEYVQVTAGRAENAVGILRDPDAPYALEVLFAGKSGDLRIVADDIVRTLAKASIEKEGVRAPVRPRDIAVLCRGNSGVDKMCQALRTRGVPVVASSNRSVFNSDEANDLSVFLRAVADPSNARAVRAALLTPLVDLDPSTLHGLASNDADWSKYVDSLVLVRSEIEHRGLGYAFERFSRRNALMPRLLRRPDGYRYATNLEHLLELAATTANSEKCGVEGILAALERARSEDGDVSVATEERALRLEHAGDAVSVMTVHKSKGLEFGIVYIEGLAKKPKTPPVPIKSAVVRHPDRGRVLAFDVGIDEEISKLLKEQQLGDDARLAYVALTRAKLSLRIIAEVNEKGETKLAETRIGAVLVGEATGSVDAHEERFESLREKGASVGLRELEEQELASTYKARVEAPALVPLVPSTRTFAELSRTSSFSGLVAGADSHRPADRDRSAESVATSSTSSGRDPLDSVPAGRELGVLVHSVLEVVGFDIDDEGLGAALDDAFASAPAFVPHRDALLVALRASLETTLFEGGPRLADLSRGRTMRELEFHLSVNNRDGFTPSALGALFTEHQVPTVGSDYGERVASLSFSKLTGFLRGFVDLVFEHEGRFHVVDYKSNRLGSDDEYRSEGLLDSMVSHHYVLQVAIYTLALHRMLRQRKRDYDYDTHMGQSLYLFLRGMSPLTGPASGVSSYLMPRAFIEALDALLEGSAS